MTTNYPPGVTGSEEEIEGGEEVADAVLDWLNQRAVSRRAPTIAAALRLDVDDVEEALQELLREGSVLSNGDTYRVAVRKGGVG